MFIFFIINSHIDDNISVWRYVNKKKVCFLFLFFVLLQFNWLCFLEILSLLIQNLVVSIGCFEGFDSLITRITNMYNLTYMYAQRFCMAL